MSKPFFGRLSRFFARPETPRTGHDALRAIMADPSMGAEARALSLEALVAMPPVSAPAATPERRHYDVPVPDVAAPFVEPAPDPEKQRRQERTEELQRIHAATVRASVAARESVQTAAVTLAHAPAATPRLRRQQIAKMRLWRKPRPVSNVVDLDAERARRGAEETPPMHVAEDVSTKAQGPMQEAHQAPPGTPSAQPPAPPLPDTAAPPERPKAAPPPRPKAVRGAAQKQRRGARRAAPTKLKGTELEDFAKEYLKTRLSGEAAPVPSSTLHKEWKRGTGYSVRTLQRAAQALEMIYTKTGLGQAWSLPPPAC